MLDLSIVIVSYNVRDYLLACLDSIYRQGADLKMEVIVVDNVSADGSVEAVKTRFPQVRLIANVQNVGFARGNNQGWAASQGRYVLFLNPDTELGAGTLEGMLTLADAHPQEAIFTCRLLNSDGSWQQSCFRFPTLRMAFYGFFPLVPMDAVANGRYPAQCGQRDFSPEHILGACLLLRREAMQAVGGWDERFFMYFEETDLCYRLRRAGYRSLYTPAFTVTHHGGRSTAPVQEKMSVAFYRSQAYFYRKNYGLARLALLKAIVFAGVLFWAARSTRGTLRGRISAALYRTRLASYWRIFWA
jgi:N-acetylglucosaminyl-diphospho-decaprenol L-rhamnosyltransferase